MEEKLEGAAREDRVEEETRVKEDDKDDDDDEDEEKDSVVRGRVRHEEVKGETVRRIGFGLGLGNWTDG